ncbi:hypothetical protein [Bradyrhizobium japonicum]|uniref:hypothetical protein n=1 Tax=Bradyrhizobium japonicum TaxID=375 RepID=UPI001BAD9073|nr:hypothetical protein [Bradyrhizobium japonicum]MBR0913601.1 hypothetical protein [Bradyrhizobium japonicum]
MTRKSGKVLTTPVRFEGGGGNARRFGFMRQSRVPGFSDHEQSSSARTVARQDRVNLPCLPEFHAWISELDFVCFGPRAVPKITVNYPRLTAKFRLSPE